MAVAVPEGVEVLAPADGDILAPAALALVARLQRELGPTRRALLERRRERQAELDAGVRPDFLAETRAIRDGDWVVPPAPRDLEDRRCEITGPVERKMMINALNSGARVFMADFEDANSPTWANVVEGQRNVRDAVRRELSLDTAEKSYRLNERTATLLVRPRGWHLPERHVLVDGEPVSASFFDVALWLWHNGAELLERGSGPYLYLPKLESHLEAKLWNDAFELAQDAVGIPRGSVRATVLIETVLAAFEMEEILHALGPHATALNAGRWDYIFSVIKKLGRREDALLPDRAQVTMTVPFMRAYTELLVRSCHRRGAHAIGGMAAFIPSRRDPEVNRIALARVREDKERESQDGFDGTWVAHPDLVPVATEVFDDVLDARLNQLSKQRPEVNVTADDLLSFDKTPGEITEAGLRQNISVGLQYIESWLLGVGAASIFNLMEDAATAEISRSQIWQWTQHSGKLSDGRAVTKELVRQIMEEELAKLPVDEPGRRFKEAHEIFEQVSLSDDFVDFLTWPAYDLID
ncbi:MAG TPA: malate synthase A [Gaiellaceae bacterium]|nr:malate synthase A [Gaiellaceae bacterium]